MSNKEEDFIPYFKIRWAKRSAWTLEQSAYLSCGKDPDLKNYEIAVTATNPISKRYYWLVNKLKKEYLEIVETVDGVDYFNTGSLFRLLEEKFKTDKDMRKAIDHMYDVPYGVDHTKFVSRAVYREAGNLVFKQYPSATKSEVAKAIKELPKFFNNDHHGHIETLESHQIEAYLKGINDLTGKQKTIDKVHVVVDLAQLVEKM